MNRSSWASTPHQRADCHLPLRKSIANMVQGLISHGYKMIGLFQCSSGHFVGDDGNRPAGMCVHLLDPGSPRTKCVGWEFGVWGRVAPIYQSRSDNEQFYFYETKTEVLKPRSLAILL